MRRQSLNFIYTIISLLRSVDKPDGYAIQAAESTYVPYPIGVEENVDYPMILPIVKVRSVEVIWFPSD